MLFVVVQQGTSVGVDVPSGLRNVQSTHTFFPQAGPAGGPPGPQDMRPHSWDNSGAQLNNMAMQSQLLNQINPQLLASLNSQVGPQHCAVPPPLWFHGCNAHGGRSFRSRLKQLLVQCSQCSSFLKGTSALDLDGLAWC